jgi:microcystin degradation protein MlrC
MATGRRVRMGRTAVLDTGALKLVISERRAEPLDLGVFMLLGIDHAALHADQVAPPLLRGLR